MPNPEVDAFAEWFYRDLEKGFTADIACCDACHGDFLAVWPYADSADDYRFQTTSINLDAFYEGSYLRDEYSKAEFDRLISQLSCPRCGSPLGGNIWPYNFPFNVPQDFEHTIRDVAALAKATPFLLLEHDFCRKVLSAVRSLAATLPIQKLERHLYRGRSEVNDTVAEHVRAFDFPPPRVVQEGRFNHSGHPVLYLGSDVDTCHAELREAPSLILEFELQTKLRVLDLIDPYKGDQASLDHADLLNCLVYSALVSARQESDGWQRPHYVVSRFVADCARASSIDAIRYPSTRRAGNNFNLVVLNPNLQLEKFARVVQFHRRGAA
ncbi:RES family NAD+ phosphorylase [Nevskia sp.]|uniref:RES family NAD+ phosphorylase n=1 Tax=Nevskia sp. TaxID=1929292 RepID=UPI003F70A029